MGPSRAGSQWEVEDEWRQRPVPDDPLAKIQDVYQAIVNYHPGVEPGGLSMDHVGIRPELVPPSGGFQNFVLRTDHPVTLMWRCRRATGTDD